MPRNYNFNYDNDGRVVVYIDGACENNGYYMNGSSAGIGVWFGDRHPLNLAEPVNHLPTNNRAEIQAAKRAIEQATKGGVQALLIKTDSEFLISAMTKWMKKWRQNGYVLSNGNRVQNHRDFRALDNAIQNANMRIFCKHVRGHSGVYGNEQADRLAKLGAQNFREQHYYSSSD